MCSKSLANVCSFIVLLAFSVMAGFIGNMIVFRAKYGRLDGDDFTHDRTHEIWNVEGNWWIWAIGTFFLLIFLNLMCTACWRASRKKATNVCYDIFCCSGKDKKERKYQMLTPITHQP